jgi:vacuolar-type H+-ATPase subunit I/STV1
MEVKYMKGYLQYVVSNIRKGNYTTGILMIITLIGYSSLLITGTIYKNIYIGIACIIWLIAGTGISITWNNYWIENKKYK